MNSCQHCGNPTQPIKIDVEWCPSCGCVTASHGSFGRTFEAQPAIVSTVETILQLTKQEETEKETAIRRLLLRYRGINPPVELGGEDPGTVAPPTDGHC